METPKNDRVHWKHLFNYEYLGAHSLDEDEERVVTITGTETRLVKTRQNPDGDDCPVILFKEMELPMVLNKTNCKMIESIYGPIVKDWTGKTVTLYVQEGVRYQRTTVDALRIKEGEFILDQLKRIFAEIKPTLTDDEVKLCERITGNKEKLSYSKMFDFLKTKGQE
jgi:hypothetical protein